MKVLLLFFVLLIVSSCSRIAPPDAIEVQSHLCHRIHKQVDWTGHSCSQNGAVCFLLDQGLTIESAVQIALLNNPRVQILLDEIGIAYADLIEAGLFCNPIFDGYVRFPDKPLDLNTQFSVVQCFLDVFLIPLRKKVAAAEVQRVKLQVASDLMDLAFEVEKTFYHYLALEKKMQLQELLVEAADLSWRLSYLQDKQGNINELESGQRKSEYFQTQIAFTETKAETLDAREKLNRLLGYTSSSCWKTAVTLPQVVCMQTCPCCLEERAIAKRLDMEALRWEAIRYERTWRTKRWWAFADGVVGLSSEHEAEGFQETGPTISLPIPLFNYGQGQRARLKMLYDQTLNRLKEMEVRVRSEVRLASEKMKLYGGLVEQYQAQILPLQEGILSTSHCFYNAMALGVYKLIEAKKRVIELEIEYTNALERYWEAKVDLDQAIGEKIHG